MWTPYPGGIQIRRLGDKESSSCRLASMEGGACGIMRRPAWRRTITRKQDEGATTFPSRAVMVCNTVKRTFASSTNAASTMSDRDFSLGWRMVGHDISTVVGSMGGGPETNFCRDRNLLASDSVSGLDDREYDPETLLLEPLLPSPRSNEARENRAGSIDISSGSSICENAFADGHMMSHCGSNGEPEGLGTWDQHTSNGPNSHRHPISSAMPGLLAHTLVPISPANSGTQAAASFIPGDTRLPPPATSGTNGNNNAAWHLKLPQHAQHGTTAAAVAAAAANVAAAIQHASIPFPANYPGMSQAISMTMSENPTSAAASTGRILSGVNSSNVTTINSRGAGDGGTGYSSEDARRCWQLTEQSNDGQVRNGGDVSTDTVVIGNSGSTMNSVNVDVAGSSGASPRHDDLVHRSRFVTREECVPGIQTSRSIPYACGGGKWPESGAVDQSRGARSMHGVLVSSPYSRPAASAQGMGSDCASTISATDAIQGWQSSAVRCGVKRLHSQSGDSSSPLEMRASSAATEAMDKMDTTHGVTTSVSAAVIDDSTRIPPTSSSASGLRINTSAMGSAAQAKRLKILGASDGSQGWGNITRSDGGRGGAGKDAVGLQIGWGMGSDNNHSSAAITPEDLHRINPTQVPDLITPRRRSTRCTSGPSATSSTSTANASLSLSNVKQDETTEEDEDSTGGGGDSSPDWHERDESEEEGSKPGVKAKAPFKLDPRLWVVVERRAVCSAKQCAYRSEDDHRARRRHYHALCSHVHQNGERKGMRFQHHQLEKVQKHQRAHQVSAKQNSQRASVIKNRSPSGSPVSRSKRSSSAQGLREQSKAIKDANVEAHSPKDWTPELTKRLRELVDELGPKWSAIAEKIPGKTATACMLHWRVGLNPNHMVKGSGTWTAEEDERLSKLVEVVGMKWSDLARHIPGRIAKQCRERYLNHLDPSLRKDKPWTEDEEALLMRLCFAKQNQWAEICRQLKGRSYNDVKNRFNLIQRRNKRASLAPAPAQKGSGGNYSSSSPGGTSPATPGSISSKSDTIPPKRGSNASNNGSGGSDGRTSVGVGGQMKAPTGIKSMSTGASITDASKYADDARAMDASVAIANTPASSGEANVSGAATDPMNGSPSAADCSDANLIAEATAATVSAAGGWSAAANAVAAADAADAAAATRGVVGKPLVSTSTDSASGSGSKCGVLLSTSPNSAALTGGRPSQHIERHRRSGSGDGAGSVVCSTGNSISNGSSFSLLGDELGEFGLGETEMAGPGSGFAPGGYWHQMVKEEARAGQEFGDEHGNGAAVDTSMPPGPSTLLPSSPLTGLMDMDEEEGEGGVRLPPPPPLDGEETAIMDTKPQWGNTGNTGNSSPTFSAPVSSASALGMMDSVSRDAGAVAGQAVTRFSTSPTASPLS